VCSYHRPQEHNNQAGAHEGKQVDGNVSAKERHFLFKPQRIPLASISDQAFISGGNKPTRANAPQSAPSNKAAELASSQELTNPWHTLPDQRKTCGCAVVQEAEPRHRFIFAIQKQTRMTGRQLIRLQQNRQD